MMTTRIAGTLTGEGRWLADEIAARLLHLGQACHGTLIVGSGDPAILQGGEARPRVIVPLVWYHRPNPVGRDQIANADAVVLIDDEELDAITGVMSGEAPASPPIVVAADDATRRGLFLRQTNPYEAVAAARALAGHAALQEALPSAAGLNEAWRELVDIACEAIVEAFIVMGGTVPSPEPRPEDQR